MRHDQSSKSCRDVVGSLVIFKSFNYLVSHITLAVSLRFARLGITDLIQLSALSQELSMCDSLKARQILPTLFSPWFVQGEGSEIPALVNTT